MDDIEGCLLVRGAGLAAHTLLGGKLAYCRMYRGFREAVDGFAKSLYPSFKYSVPFVLWFFATWLLGTFGWLLFWHWTWLLAGAMSIAAHLMVAMMARFHVVEQLLLYVVQVSLWAATAVYSVVVTRQKRATWKGRNIHVG